MDSSSVEGLRSQLTALREEAHTFFSDAALTIERKFAESNPEYKPGSWGPIRVIDGRAVPELDVLTEEQRNTARRMRKQLTELGVRLLELVKHSPLMEQADQGEFRELLRGLSACLAGKEYRYYPSSVISQEDRVYGIDPAHHVEEDSTIESCGGKFRDLSNQLLEKMELIAPAPENLASAIVSANVPAVQKYRKNTAFIMMQISSTIPELEDIKNSIKEVFKEFGIDARRSDEIEHSETITQRILDEIATSEFLIADLTGERPSVYYEVGYAHAIGKRPILYRKKGSPLHFDLLVHNVPEYVNNADLRAQLRKRLSAITNREPKR